MEDKKKHITSSMEDYLEAIAGLKRKNSQVRVSDISKELSVKKSSVNAALGSLARKGYVSHERYGAIDLTDKGLKTAKAIQSRHDLLFRFLSEILKIDVKTAQKDACRMEHGISSQTIDKLLKFVDQVERCPGFNKSSLERK